MFTLIQPFHLNLQIANHVCFQTFATLWNDEPDTRILEVIEKGLLQGILPPVKLLRLAGEILHVVYSSDIHCDAQTLFEDKWAETAKEFNWFVNFIPELQASIVNTGDRAFVNFADEILFSHSIGLWELTEARLRRHRMVDSMNPLDATGEPLRQL